MKGLMDKLNMNWFADGLLDFEYKKYTLLAYLQSVDRYFGTYRLFPPLTDLIAHQEYLRAFIQRKQELSEQFPKKLLGANLEQLSLEYQPVYQDTEQMKVLEEIISYAQPLFQRGIEYGKSIYDEVEKLLEFMTVGVTPINKNEGYLLVVHPTNASLKIFRYSMSLFTASGEQYRALHLAFLSQRRWRPWVTLENIKLELLKTYPDLPNPATYAIEVQKKLPEEETLLPVAKRLLVRRLSDAA